MSNRACWEWIIAYGLHLLNPERFSRQFLIQETHLKFEGLMKTCRKCGREYYSECLNCLYRNGGEITGSEDDRAGEDLCEQMLRLQSGQNFAVRRLRSQLASMRIQLMNQWP